ncbi:hypothetical protein C2W59_02469 [Bacillus pumilus]|uniref:Uncharacterized protein n=1 Tax=Bacillus pumilus TaxID=1408 RepID=A0AB34QZT4_BACPU|nr:hypothetical protein B4127_3904 [Bacillus pumilus]RAP16126.1 hypothetical protein C2W58_01781 [Bacillus pumilus]RAP23623.1 hypothetical protein C2W59_02469 [Bacillus pumilus]
MMKKWLITTAILTLLITGVSIGASIQKNSQSAQSQDIIQKRDRGTNP